MSAFISCGQALQMHLGSCGPISLKKSLCCRGAGGLGPTGLGTVVEVVASRRRWRGHRDQFGELAEILGCGCEVELVAGPVRSS